MKLTILYNYGTKHVILGVTRLFTITYADRHQTLYYETCNHETGYGGEIDLHDVKCWEATATVQGGNITL